MRLLPKPKPMPTVDSSISKGAQLARVVIVFFLIGLGIDTWLGTTPWFMLGLLVFGVAGQFTKMYYVYNDRMKVLEERRAQDASGH